MSKYDYVMIETAKLFAEQSYCKKLHVGAVAVKDGRPIATGYNGTVPGTDNCCEDESGSTKDTTIHAEQNIIFYAAREGISLKGSTMYITHNPCEQCAKAMAASGVTMVVYEQFYKNDDGLQFLEKCGVIHRQLERK
jgi:dCMP deaminase